MQFCFPIGSLLCVWDDMQEWRLNSIGGRCDSRSIFALQQEVACLSFSPFVPDLMVAGHSGGLIAVYSMRSSTALMVVQVRQSTKLLPPPRLDIHILHASELGMH